MTGPNGEPLSDVQRRMLEFERQWWRTSGGKVQAIRDTFGVPVAAYYMDLNALLSSPAALAFDPPLVNRLIRRRDDTARLRLAGRR